MVNVMLAGWMVMCKSCSFAIDDEVIRAFDINLLVYYQNINPQLNKS